MDNSKLAAERAIAISRSPSGKREGTRPWDKRTAREARATCHPTDG